MAICTERPLDARVACAKGRGLERKDTMMPGMMIPRWRLAGLVAALDRSQAMIAFAMDGTILRVNALFLVA